MMPVTLHLYRVMTPSGYAVRVTESCEKIPDYARRVSINVGYGAREQDITLFIQALRELEHGCDGRGGPR